MKYINGNFAIHISPDQFFRFSKKIEFLNFKDLFFFVFVNMGVKNPMWYHHSYASFSTKLYLNIHYILIIIIN